MKFYVLFLLVSPMLHAQSQKSQIKVSPSIQIESGETEKKVSIKPRSLYLDGKSEEYALDLNRAIEHLAYSVEDKTLLTRYNEAINHSIDMAQDPESAAYQLLNLLPPYDYTLEIAPKAFVETSQMGTGMKFFVYLYGDKLDHSYTELYATGDTLEEALLLLEEKYKKTYLYSSAKRNREIYDFVNTLESVLDSAPSNTERQTLRRDTEMDSIVTKNLLRIRLKNLTKSNPPTKLESKGANPL